MEFVKSKYDSHCSTSSDINEHLPTLVKYAGLCNHITEMGIRWGSSTWAFLYSNPKKLVSYDIIKNQEIEEIIEVTSKLDLNFEFLQKDVLLTEIELTELLFIDTLHTYNQLTQELNLHCEKVLKYIILHDTESFCFEDEHIYEHASKEIKNMNVHKKGLCNAIEDFLLSEKGKKWKVIEKYNNNNGLTIMERL